MYLVARLIVQGQFRQQGVVTEAWTVKNLDWEVNKDDKVEEVEFFFVSGTVLVPVKIYFETLIQSFRIQLQNNLPTFDELNEME